MGSQVSSVTLINTWYLLTIPITSIVRNGYPLFTFYLDPEDWIRKSIINVASMGKFSSDRAIKEYAGDTEWMN